jgi:HEAT repeat protein
MRTILPGVLDAVVAGTYGPVARTAVPDFIRYFKGDVGTVLGPENTLLKSIRPETVVKISELLGDRNSRRMAAFVLGELGTLADQAVPMLAEHVCDAEGFGIVVSDTLGKLGPVAEPALPALSLVVSTSDDPAARRSALLAVGEIQTSSAASALAGLLSSSLFNSSDRTTAVATLGRLPWVPKQAEPCLQHHAIRARRFAGPQPHRSEPDARTKHSHA